MIITAYWSASLQQFFVDLDRNHLSVHERELLQQLARNKASHIDEVAKLYLVLDTKRHSLRWKP